eukprot:6637103-Prymnesium_polylepis.1
MQLGTVEHADAMVAAVDCKAAAGLAGPYLGLGLKSDAERVDQWLTSKVGWQVVCARRKALAIREAQLNQRAGAARPVDSHIDC